MGGLYINANGHFRVPFCLCFKTSLVQTLPPENGPPDETQIHNRGSARRLILTQVKGNPEMAYYVTSKSLKLSINYRVRSFSLITLRCRSCLFVLKKYVTMTVKWSQIIVNLFKTLNNDEIPRSRLFFFLV